MKQVFNTFKKSLSILLTKTVPQTSAQRPLLRKHKTHSYMATLCQHSHSHSH